MKDDGKSVDLLLEQRLDGFRRHIPSGEARAARRDHNVHVRIGDPVLDLGADRRHIVLDQRAVGDLMPRFPDHLGKRIAGRVGGEVARVRHGQHSNADRDERPTVIDLGHVIGLRILSAADQVPQNVCTTISSGFGGSA